MKRTGTLLLVLLAGSPLACYGQSEAKSGSPPPADGWVDAHLNELVDLYKDFHSHPELSYQEVRTSARVAEELNKAGARVTTGVGKLGVVGVLENGPGPVVLIRTDMDALPVREETGLPYASKATAKD